ncbi:carbohydrate kinase family protein, partial [Athalassotoga sp.]|uniref:carbohydrate kinase family protein n=1 Tax=Athalassotoga sp. TaxID=2022597 RepID=UPI003D08A301
MFKIDDSFEPHVGGSPLNIAVGIARLGEKVSYITKFSYDFFGEMLKDTLKQENVDISLSMTDCDLHTTLAFAFVDERKVPKFA